MIDLYCERTGPGLLDEPFNTVSNVAFLVAAYLCHGRVRKWPVPARSDPKVRALIALTVLIGLGSATFHAFATRWSQGFDVLPILLFQILYVWYYLRYQATASRRLSVRVIVGFLVLSGIGSRFPGTLNGSVAYLPSALVLVGIGLHQARALGRSALLLASGTFLLALVFRTIDHTCCDTFPMGTHFLWHLLTAAVLYVAVLSLQPQVARPEVE